MTECQKRHHKIAIFPFALQADGQLLRLERRETVLRILKELIVAQQAQDFGFLLKGCFWNR